MKDIYIITGEKKEHFFNSEYTSFEIEANTDELIKMLADSKIIINSVIRKTINNG